MKYQSWFVIKLFLWAVQTIGLVWWRLHKVETSLPLLWLRRRRNRYNLAGFGATGATVESGCFQTIHYGWGGKKHERKDDKSKVTDKWLENLGRKRWPKGKWKLHQKSQQGGGSEDNDGYSRTAGRWAWERFVLFLLWCSDAVIWLLSSVPPVCPVYFQLRK